MNIQSIKDLEAIIKLCRRQGVSTIEIDGVKLSLGEPPQRNNAKYAESDTKTPISDPEYSDEQLLMWSASSGA